VILWSAPVTAIDPYIRHRRRELLFREAVILFLGAKDPVEEEERLTAAYCEACRRAGLDSDCDSCPGPEMIEHDDQE